MEHNLTNVSNSVAGALPDEVSRLISFLIGIVSALGGFVFLYVVFQIINTRINRKRNDKVKEINKNLEEIKELLRKK